MVKPQLQAGALGEWTKARDLPQADGESFRQWFNNRDERVISMDLQNRENFLNKLAAKMGVKPVLSYLNRWMRLSIRYPTERLTHLSAVDLANEFINSAKTMTGGCKCV